MSSTARLGIASTFAGRFVIEGAPEAGGMATVYRARDLERGGAEVAVKVATITDGARRTMFERECSALERLSHPGIVRHLAHGFDGDVGWLAMSWVAGPTLKAVLARRPSLDLEQALAMARGLADALAAVHDHGLVHRDVKPANIVLEAGDPTRPVLVDFGTVCGDGLPSVTLDGAPTGTVGYMAPERFSSMDAAGPEADVWSLGAVLWESLRGEPVIEGASALAVMTRTVVAEPRTVARTGIPPRLAALVDRTLRRDPGERPRDGRALRDELAALDRRGPAPAAPLGDTERTFLCVALVGPSAPHAPDLADFARAPEALRDVARIARAHGLAAREIDAGVYVLWTRVSEATPPSTIAWRAARCALAVHASTGARAVIASGLGEVTRGSPEGEVIEQALALWELPVVRGSLRVSAFTADLLAEETDVAHDGSSALLHVSTPLRLVDERPLIGRDHERSTIAAWLAATADRPGARTMLVTAAPGLGKSRLCDAALRTVPPSFSALLAECDASTEQATFRTLRAFVAAASLAPIGCDPAELREALVAHASALGLGPARATFLGELADPRDPEVPRELLGARTDPSTWARTVGVAFADWLEAWSTRQPTALVIDDVQWSDGPSLVCLDLALSRIERGRVALLGFARPEVREVRAAARFLRSQTVSMDLPPLRAEDAVALLREASTAAARALPTKRAEELASIAEGNPLFLLELARAERVAERSPRSLTPVLHMRFQGVDADVRRLLRAATLFGVVFPIDGCVAVSGLEPHAVDALMARAAEAELLMPALDGEHGRFCHALVRAAAYEMLGAEDRANGHASAAAWLLARRPADHATIAMHLEQSGDHARATERWLDAARSARATNDLELSERFAAFGLSCADKAEVRGAVRAALGVLLAEAAGLHHRHVTSIELAERALDEAPTGSTEFYEAMAYLARALESGRDRARCAGLVQRFEETALTTEAPGPYVRTGLQLASSMALSGSPDVASTLLGRFTGMLRELPDARIHAQYHTTVTAVSVTTLAYGPAIQHAKLARDTWVKLQGEAQEAAASRVLGMLLGQIGDDEPGQAALHHAITVAERRDLGTIRTIALASLGQLHELAGRLDIALEYRRTAAREVAASDDARTHGSILVGLGRVLARAGDWSGARRAAEDGARLLEGGTRLARAQVLLAEVAAYDGRLSEARALVEAAWAGLLSPQDRDHLTHGYLVGARVFAATGDRARAEEAARVGLDVLARVARSLDVEARGQAASRPLAARMLAIPAYRELLDAGRILGLAHPLLA